MTKQTKIFVSIVLCCTLLFALGVTSFGADEPSENNQVILPSGEYTWNAYPIFPTFGTSGTYDIDISYTVPPISVTAEGETVLISLDGTKITFTDYNTDGVRTITYYGTLFFNGVDGGLGALVYDSVSGWNVFSETIGFNVGHFGQTIILSSDQSLSSDDYVLLTSNFSSSAPDYEGNPFTDIMNLVIEALDVPIFGTFSLWDMLTTLCGLFAVVWLLKLLAGG